MPRKKIKKNTIRAQRVTPQPFNQRHDKFAQFRWGESYTSLLLGIVVVIVAVLFGVSIIRQTHHVQQITAIQTGPTVTIEPSATPTSTQGTTIVKNGQKVYTVQSGDELWSIAEKFYNSGYNWVDIARVNNLSDPGMIYAGNQLIIPNVASKEVTVSLASTTVQPGNAITGNSYTVQKGDSLWNISVRAYGDGYKWTTIASANSLSNPNAIFSGNVLTIPR